MRQHCLCGDRRGLTLIELVLTLTILALAGALVTGALATGLRAWQSGLRSGREELVARIVLERIGAQLRAAIVSPAKLSGENAIAFDVAENRLRFVTLAAAGAAPVQVSYEERVDGGESHLLYREFPWPDKDFFGQSRPRREEKVVEVTGFAVKAVSRGTNSDGETSDPGDGSTQSEWNPLDKALPESVSVEITVNAEGLSEPRRFQITVPVPTQKTPE